MRNSGWPAAALSATVLILVAGGCAPSAEPEGQSVRTRSAAAQPKTDPDYPGMPQLPPGDGPLFTPTPTPTPPPASPTPAPSIDYAALTKTVSSGVFSVVATGCGPGSRIGTAFLVDEQSAVTSSAVVAGMEVVALSSGSTVLSAKVESVLPAAGVAVLRLDSSAQGHVFSVVDAEPEVGGPVGQVGIEAGADEVGLTTSTITEVGASADSAGGQVSELARTDTEIDAGRAGGPTLGPKGEATGMALGGADPGPMLIIAGSAINEAVSGGAPPEVGSCDDARGPDLTKISGESPKRIESSLLAYFGGINSGNYRQAYKQLGPASTKDRDFEDYRDGWASSHDFNIAVESTTGRTAHVTFNSIFLPGKGPEASMTCARWDIDYTFVESGDRLLINKAEPHSGAETWTRC